ncbi:MAG TPA: hypothetical protein PKK17_11095 [Sphingorhabdus lacus]|jgi:hypothetical protein|uniref:hypothetical protein n=1 Tax=Sphingorhabdus sp. TaxID=1902408 RepID=UPI00261C22A0|nr:hypothetical protein [Sphingorhabdus sp.]MBL0022867.1 hypothetical protein [Sphingomonadales bacterium]HNW19051.1 hypothetical protein [Sphingorhabdus lacus]HMS21116.1 hypothetical protein [Sphingorhabdus sp.]HMT42593.1 hypothetical protein [Sphingorhabdus sp.]HMU21390.1 hypothetical protein [Sphingorhabdus sp.]
MPEGQGSQIVGFRLDTELARKVKAEAGRRGIRLNVLFEELWAGYEKQAKAVPKK